MSLCFVEVYEKGEDENPILNLGMFLMRQTDNTYSNMLEKKFFILMTTIKVCLYLLQVQRTTCLKGTFSFQ